MNDDPTPKGTAADTITAPTPNQEQKATEQQPASKPDNVANKGSNVTNKTSNVASKASLRKQRKLTLSKKHCFIIGGTILAALIIFVSAGIWLSSVTTPIDEPPIADVGTELANGAAGGDADVPEPPVAPQPNASPSFINLQATVDAWLKTTNRQVGLMVYDLDHDRVAASYQANRVFNVASIYKLFYVYDGYRQLASGAEEGSTRFVTTRDYRAGTYTIAECLDLMIRESYNGCADAMRANAARSARVQSLITELGLSSTSNLGLSSTANDLTDLLRLYYDHPDLTDELWNDLADSMLIQPPTRVDGGMIYDWRQGLPAGFKTANVYNKVGWDRNVDGKSWNTYADAAIVEFPKQDRHYTVVVLTIGFTDAKAIAQLGTALENAILSAED